jgi:hypothetical protein
MKMKPCRYFVNSIQRQNKDNNHIDFSLIKKTGHWSVFFELEKIVKSWSLEKFMDLEPKQKAYISSNYGVLCNSGSRVTKKDLAFF